MDDSPAARKRSRSNVILLGTVSFINDASSKIILPILPLFIAQLGGGGLAVGLTAGLGDSAASLAKLFAGYWSDRLGRRKAFVFTGYLLSALAKLLLAFTTTWHQVVGLRVAERLGKGVRSAPRDALLAASTDKPRRGRGFGLHRAMDSAGALLGTLLVLLLYWYFGLGFPDIFLIAGLLGFASLLPLSVVQERGDGKRATPPRLEYAALSPALRRFMLIAFTYALANFSYMFFVLRAGSLFEERSLAVLAPVLLYALYQFSFTLFAIPAGILSDRVGRRAVLIAGYGLFTLLCLGFILAETLIPLLLLFTLYGLNNALVEATERTLVADLAAESERGTVLGAYHMTTSLAALPAGLLAGLLWDLEPLYTFAAGALLSAAALVLLTTLLKADRPAS
ncbi:MAG TPA: MFS transporter [Gammaproteobacteria bacterium]|jgi:MFS family permease